MTIEATTKAADNLQENSNCKNNYLSYKLIELVNTVIMSTYICFKHSTIWSSKVTPDNIREKIGYSLKKKDLYLFNWLHQRALEFTKFKNQAQRNLIEKAQRGDIKDLSELLKSPQIDINFPDFTGWTASNWAFWYNQPQALDLLKAKNATLEYQDMFRRSLLHWAVLWQKKDLLNLLIDKGFNLESKDGNKQTALMVAVEKSYLDIVQILLEKGADRDAKDCNGNTALDLVL